MSVLPECGRWRITVWCCTVEHIMYSDVFSLKWFIVISHLHRRPPSLADVEMERRGNGGKGERDNVTHDMTPVITLFTRDAWFYLLCVAVLAFYISVVSRHYIWQRDHCRKLNRDVFDWHISRNVINVRCPCDSKR